MALTMLVSRCCPVCVFAVRRRPFWLSRPLKIVQLFIRLQMPSHELAAGVVILDIAEMHYFYCILLITCWTFSSLSSFRILCVSISDMALSTRSPMDIPSLQCHLYPPQQWGETRYWNRNGMPEGYDVPYAARARGGTTKLHNLILIQLEPSLHWKRCGPDWQCCICVVRGSCVQ